MKKLMTLIGAVATAFGLFAADPVVTGSASFESVNEFPGMLDQDLTTFTPASPTWTWAGDPLTLGDYNNDDYEYVDATGNKRRTFAGDPLQNKYLKLETTKTEKLEFNAISGNSIFVDQLVQFTGFEEEPDVDGAKIAVWMSEFVTSEENVEPEVTETNLYITAGVDSAASAKASVKLDGTYEIGKWYRLTIKSLGAIAEDGTVGFIVYIDGNQVGSSDQAAKALINPGLLSQANADLLAQGKLFPAMATGAIASVGYNGIGAIDDITIDDQGPEFARKIPFTVADAGGALTFVVTAGGVTVDPAEGVLAGTEVTVTYAAASGYKTFGNTVVTQTIDADNNEISADDIDVQEVVATVENGGTTMGYAERELYTLVTSGLVDGDVATFLEESTTITNGEGATVYVFAADTTITVSVADEVTTWAIESVTGEDLIEDYVGADENFNKVYTLADEDSSVVLYGNVAGELTAANVDVAAAIEVSGTLKAAALTIDDSITLVDSGKVLSQDNTLTILDSAGGEVEVSEDTDDDGYYTYAIATEVTFYFAEMEHASVIAVKDASEAPIVDDGEGNYTAEPGTQLSVTVQAEAGYLFDGAKTKIVPITVREGEIDLEVEPVKAGFAIIIAGDEPVTEYYTTLDAAIAAYKTGVITVLENATIDETVTIAKDVAINLNGKTLTFANNLPKCINAAEAGSLAISNGTITVAEGRANVAGSRAIYLLHNTSVVLKDLTLDLPGFEYVLNKDCDLDPINDCWAKTPACTFDCDNVVINGNGSLFHFENAIATLTGCSTTQNTTLDSFGGAHAAAIYSSCGGETVIDGGTFTAPNALQTGNMGAVIVVKSGTFNGNIKSWMYEGDTRWPDNAASIVIQGGTFTGDFAYGTGQAGACTKDCLTWNITAGTFSVDPTAYLANAYKAVEDAGKWTVEAKVFFESISLDKTALALTVGGTETLVATPSPATDDDSLVWTSSAEGVATVANGVVTAVAAGEATITVKSANNESVKATCTVTVSAAPSPVEPVKPGEEITPAAGDTIEVINGNDEIKAKYLKGPEGFTADKTYRDYFDAVPAGTDGKIKFELNTAGQAALQDNANGEIVKIKPDQIAALTTESGQFKVEATIPGFYYAVKQGNGVGTMKVIYEGSLATDDKGVDLDFKKFPGAGFYSIVISPTPIAAAPTEE